MFVKYNYTAPWQIPQMEEGQNKKSAAEATDSFTHNVESDAEVDSCSAHCCVEDFLECAKVKSCDKTLETAEN